MDHSLGEKQQLFRDSGNVLNKKKELVHYVYISFAVHANKVMLCFELLWNKKIGKFVLLSNKFNLTVGKQITSSFSSQCGFNRDVIGFFFWKPTLWLNAEKVKKYDGDTKMTLHFFHLFFITLEDLS